MSNDIFISYESTSAKEIVDLFIDEFEKADISAWVDIENLYKSPGGEFDPEIMKQIKNSKAVLLILTKEALNKKYVKDEINHAFKLGKQVLCFPHFNEGEDIAEQLANFHKDTTKLQLLGSIDQISRIPAYKEFLEDQKTTKLLQSHIGTQPETEDHQFLSSVMLARIGVQMALEKELLSTGSYKTISSKADLFNENNMRMWVNNKSMFISPEPNQEKRIETFMAGTKKWKAETLALYNNVAPDNKELVEALYMLIETKCNVSRSEAEKIVEDVKETTTDLIEAACKVNSKMYNGAMVGVYNIIDNTGLEIELYQSDFFTFKFTEQLFRYMKRQGVTFNINITNIKEYAPILCSIGLGGYVVVEHDNKEYLMWGKRSPTGQAANLWHFSYDRGLNLLQNRAINNLRYEDSKNYIQSSSRLVLDVIDKELGLEALVNQNAKFGAIEIGLIEVDRLEIEILSYAKVVAPDNQTINEYLSPYIDLANEANDYNQRKYIPFTDADMRSELHGRAITPEALMLSKKLLALKTNEVYRKQQYGKKNVLF